MTSYLRGALAASCIIALCWGCASSPGSTAPAAPEDTAAAAAQRYIDALRANSAEQLAATLSDSFSHPEYGGKEAFVSMMRQFTAIRYFEGMTADTTAMLVQEEGASATAGPAALSGSFGAMTLSFTLAREPQAWRITGVDFAGQ